MGYRVNTILLKPTMPLSKANTKALLSMFSVKMSIPKKMTNVLIT